MPGNRARRLVLPPLNKSLRWEMTHLYCPDEICFSNSFYQKYIIINIKKSNIEYTYLCSYNEIINIQDPNNINSLDN